MLPVVKEEPAASALRVVPSNVRLDPITRVFTPAAPLPARIPERVVEPVPPYTPESEVVADTTPLIAWRGPVRDAMVRPPLKVFAPLHVLVFESNVEDANDQVEVAKV